MPPLAYPDEVFVSEFTRDMSMTGEYLAGLWQGDVPADFVLHQMLYFGGGSGKGRVMFIWQGGPEAQEFVRERFGTFGELVTRTAVEGTDGLSYCFNRDMDGFAAMMRARYASTDGEAEVQHQLSVRMAGANAETFEAAREAGRNWQPTRQPEAARREPNAN